MCIRLAPQVYKHNGPHSCCTSERSWTCFWATTRRSTRWPCNWGALTPRTSGVRYLTFQSRLVFLFIYLFIFNVWGACIDLYTYEARIIFEDETTEASQIMSNAPGPTHPRPRINLQPDPQRPRPFASSSGASTRSTSTSAAPGKSFRYSRTNSSSTPQLPPPLCRSSPNTHTLSHPHNPKKPTTHTHIQQTAPASRAAASARG